MKTKNSLFPLALFAVLCFLMGGARAQQDPDVPQGADNGPVDGGFGAGFGGVPGDALGDALGGAPDGVPDAGGIAGTRVYVAEENSLSQLPGIIARPNGPGAVSLRASEETFNANPAARDALLAWVRAGNVVFLHTGAARAFGFVTVDARPGTNQVAGQLFGRARAALPFGASPLLMANGPTLATQVAGRRPNTDPTQLPGVNVVFYDMQPGDHLVESHPAGTALLEVSDLAANANQALYAAAVAPFGRGWAVFTPDSIDQTRGDGALFARNLLTLVAPARGSRSGSPWVSISARAIENAAPSELRRAIAAALQVPSSPALPALGTTEGSRLNRLRRNGAAPTNATAQQNHLLGVAPLNPNGNAAATNPTNTDNGAQATNAAATAVTAMTNDAMVNDMMTGNQAQSADETGVLMSREEATSYAALLAAPGQGADVASNLLQARLLLSRGDAAGATRALEVVNGIVPNTAEVALLRGLIFAGASQEENQPSPTRATLLVDAARQLAAAAQAASVLPPPSRPAGNTGFTAPDPLAMGPNVGGIPIPTLGDLSDRLGQISQVFALEPPVVQQFGRGDAAITVRAYPNDNSLRLVVPGAQALADARNFGWRGDHEEIIVFPTPELFGAYRQALGLNGPTLPLPAGAVGDVIGQRLLMVALPSLPVIQRNPVTGLNRTLTTGNTTANVLARLHSYVLLNALDEGGSNVPAWLQLGVENLVNGVIAGDPQFGLNGQGLTQLAQAGGLLTPQQFNVGSNQNAIAQAQSASIMAYFYGQYGAGAVVETLQRLGSGQSIDEALQATTEGGEMALFQNWRAAQFGAALLPNGNG